MNRHSAVPLAYVNPLLLRKQFLAFSGLSASRMASRVATLNMA